MAQHQAFNAEIVQEKPEFCRYCRKSFPSRPVRIQHAKLCTLQSIALVWKPADRHLSKKRSCSLLYDSNTTKNKKRPYKRQRREPVPVIQEPEPESLEEPTVDEPKHAVSAILGHRGTEEEGYEFLVQWTDENGNKPREDSWETFASFLATGFVCAPLLGYILARPRLFNPRMLFASPLL